MYTAQFRGHGAQPTLNLAPSDNLDWLIAMASQVLVLIGEKYHWAGIFSGNELIRELTYKSTPETTVHDVTEPALPGV